MFFPRLAVVFDQDCLTVDEKISCSPIKPPMPACFWPYMIYSKVNERQRLLFLLPGRKRLLISNCGWLVGPKTALVIFGVTRHSSKHSVVTQLRHPSKHSVITQLRHVSANGITKQLWRLKLNFRSLFRYASVQPCNTFCSRKAVRQKDIEADIQPMEWK